MRMETVDSSRTPIKVPEGWGSIEEVVNAPLVDVAPDSWWISVIFLWLTLLIWIGITIPTMCCSCLFVTYLIGCCDNSCSILFSVLGSVKCGRSLFLAPNIYKGWLSILWAFLINGATRLRLFKWEWEAFGKGDYWYHGEGVWCWTYEHVNKIMKGVQMRKSAFGCVQAPVPDLFASDILVFLPNTPGESEWKAVRWAMHSVLFVEAEKRVKNLPAKLTQYWKDPTLTALNDASFLQLIIAKSVFWVLFDVWLDDDDGGIIAQWTTAAKTAIFPRLVQRFAFNLLINRMKSLRVNTVNIVEKHNLYAKFYEMNDLLPDKFKRTPVVKLCDEIMYILDFAGVNGVVASATTCVAFLQNQKPGESDAANIDLSKYPTEADMAAIYKRNPSNYIKEAGRIDPPVTSATSSLAEEQTLSLAGQERTFEAGTLNQYVLSMANRDTQIFKDPSVFDPNRSELNKALTWNGAFGDQTREEEEKDYPRICPGRYLAIDVVTAVINHAIGNSGA